MLVCLAGPGGADYFDDSGYTALRELLGDATPDGTGVVVAQVEADAGGGAYRPDPSNPEFAGITFTYPYSPAGSDSTVPSWHATPVGQYFYGDISGLARGVTDVYSYYAANWVFVTNLRAGWTPDLDPVAPDGAKVLNHSYIAYVSDDIAIEYLRRYDWAIDRYDIVSVAGVANGQGAIPQSWGDTFNGISVGLYSAAHSFGEAYIDGVGRLKPDLVGPPAFGLTSYATPFVAGAAAVLVDAADGDVEAMHAETIKATLMAGATKLSIPGWTREVYGAGEVNILRSYLIQQGGQFDGTGAPSSDVGLAGWDSGTGAADPLLYFFDLESPAELSAVLTWNRVVTPGEGGIDRWTEATSASSLANLDLSLYSASGYLLDTLLSSSASTTDNVELLWYESLVPGRYAFSVSGGAGTDFALAWYAVIPESPSWVLPNLLLLGILLSRRWRARVR